MSSQYTPHPAPLISHPVPRTPPQCISINLAASQSRTCGIWSRSSTSGSLIISGCFSFLSTVLLFIAVLFFVYCFQNFIIQFIYFFRISIVLTFNFYNIVIGH